MLEIDDINIDFRKRKREAFSSGYRQIYWLLCATDIHCTIDNHCAIWGILLEIPGLVKEVPQRREVKLYCATCKIILTGMWIKGIFHMHESWGLFTELRCGQAISKKEAPNCLKFFSFLIYLLLGITSSYARPSFTYF